MVRKTLNNHTRRTVGELSRSRHLSLLAIFCFTTCAAHAQIKWDAAKFMPLSEVKPGMKGKGYTVFSGITVEAFDFEVVGIQYNRYPRLHVIWAKGLSDNFKTTGSAGGMSGSPTYIDGRLMGALARSYRDQRAHGNLFGITPIELMVRVTEHGMLPNLGYRGTQIFELGTEVVTEGIDTVPSLFGVGIPPSFERQPVAALLPAPFPSEGNSERLEMPVSIPGIDSKTMRYYRTLFDRLNLVPVEAASGGSPMKTSPVEAGQTIGVASARGDFSAFGFGTITYVDGNELLAYGHARDGEGNVNLPLSGGYVHFIVPGRYRSYKVASATQPIGTLVQDRDAAIAGTIGQHPSYIPVTLNVETSNGRQYALFYEVIRHRGFSALYTEMGTAYLLEALEFASNDYTLNIGATLTLENHPELIKHEIVRQNVYSFSGSPRTAVRETLRTPLLQLLDNSHATVAIEKIDVALKLADKRRTAVVERLRINKHSYRPGETVEVEVTVRPYLEKPVTLTETLTVPKNTPDGLITLLAMSATTHERWQRSRAPLNFRPKNVNQLVELLQQRQSNTDIILALFVRQPGLTVQGEEFADLPPSVMAVMKPTTQIGDSGWTLGASLQHENIPTEYVIFGSGSIEFAVYRHAR